MRDKPTDAIRIGKVSSIDPIKCTAQVTFEDRDDSVSGDLFIVVPFTLKDKAYYMPTVGERVRVLFDPEAPSKGCILGSFYADTRLPPFGDENKTYINFEDGTLIEYDKKLNKLTINISKENETSVEVETASDIRVKCNGKVLIDSAEEIELSTDANISITVKGNSKINVDGNTEIRTKGKTNIISEDDMTVESLRVLKLKGKESELIL